MTTANPHPRLPVDRDHSRARRAQLLRPYSGSLGIVVGLLCLLAGVDMILPFLIKLLVDDTFAAQNWGLLWFILPCFGFVYVARNALFYGSRMRATRISEDLCFDLRRRLFDHLQKLNLRYYRSTQPGRVSARVLDDTFKIQAFIHDKLPTLLRYGLEFQILLVIIYAVNWRLALVSTLVLPLHLWTYRRFRLRIREGHSAAQESLAAAHGTLVERFLGAEVVKGFAGEDLESSAFRAAIDENRRSTIRTQRYQFAQKVVADLIVGIGTVGLLAFGAWEVRNGRMTGGAFFMFFWYVRMLYPAVLEVISGAGHLSKASGSVDRVFELLDEPVQESTGVVRGVAADLEGHLELDGISFAYDEPLVLEDISLSIAPGEHVAIVGPSGSGKTTLLNLLPRFHDPSEGQLLVDGCPARSLSVRMLRGLFGVVFQDVFLFEASVYENVRYARPSATREEVEEACRITGAHDIVAALPNGYDTKIGAEGVDLSRGEKQRLTLARALVRRPQILLLDEATASLDPPEAAAVTSRVLDSMKGRTVIMVTHHRHLLPHVDRVIRMEAGRIVSDGPPTMTAARPHRGLNGPGGLVGSILAALTVGLVASSFLAGCAAERPARTIDRTIDVRDPDVVARLSQALDRFDLDPRALPPPPALGLMDDGVAALRAGPMSAAGQAMVPADMPADAVLLHTLPRLSGVELEELLQGLTLRLTTRGYTEAPALAAGLPLPPAPIEDYRVLAREVPGGAATLRIGYRRFVSQPTQVWILGAVLKPGRPVERNADLDAVGAEIQGLVSAAQATRETIERVDLSGTIIQLSYADAGTAVELLQGLGVTALAGPGDLPDKVDFAALPYVVRMPDPTAKEIGLIGEGSLALGEFGVSLTPSISSPIESNAVSSPMTQLLVMYHPAHPEQFARVRRLLDEFIDRPARQIFVEGMVLEISETGLRDLGIEWEFNQGPFQWRVGSPQAEGLTDTLDLQTEDINLERAFTSDLDFALWTVKLRTLIRDGKAEVLARPSVLTINNRQSTIRVGQDIPIATSQEGTSSNANKVAFSFKYLPTGILLNIRPRINESGSEVSMLIDTIVSAVVPGADLEIRSVDGDLLASAPTVSTRRVQTYARIGHRTPLIIGGLVSREETLVQDKVPLLGDLPIVGAAFRSERWDSTKREVIIVLTPYVLPEGGLVSRSSPRDRDLFDSIGDELFRDAYRIREEDVFDLEFLLRNERLVAYRERARAMVAANQTLAVQEPYRSFVAFDVPGEPILVARMLYEVARRLESGQDVEPAQLIFFENQSNGGYVVKFLDDALARLAGTTRAAQFFDRLEGQALALTFTGADPVPALALVDVPKRDDWADVLWELNQPDARGRARASIVIRDQKDLDRLRYAVAIKRIVALNGGDEALSLRNFNAGTVIMMPDQPESKVHLIDAEVASYFFHTEHYYAATLQTMERRLNELDVRLRGDVAAVR